MQTPTAGFDYYTAIIAAGFMLVVAIAFIIFRERRKAAIKGIIAAPDAMIVLRGSGKRLQGSLTAGTEFNKPEKLRRFFKSLPKEHMTNWGLADEKGNLDTALLDAAIERLASRRVYGMMEGFNKILIVSRNDLLNPHYGKHLESEGLTLSRSTLFVDALDTANGALGEFTETYTLTPLADHSCLDCHGVGHLSAEACETCGGTGIDAGFEEEETQPIAKGEVALIAYIQEHEERFIEYASALATIESLNKTVQILTTKLANAVQEMLEWKILALRKQPLPPPLEGLNEAPTPSPPILELVGVLVVGGFLGVAFHSQISPTTEPLQVGIATAIVSAAAYYFWWKRKHPESDLSEKEER